MECKPAGLESDLKVGGKALTLSANSWLAHGGPSGHTWPTRQTGDTQATGRPIRLHLRDRRGWCGWAILTDGDVAGHLEFINPKRQPQPSGPKAQTRDDQ